MSKIEIQTTLLGRKASYFISPNHPKNDDRIGEIVGVYLDDDGVGGKYIKVMLVYNDGSTFDGNSIFLKLQLKKE